MCTFSLVFSLARRLRPYTVCVYLPDTYNIGFIISQLCLSLARVWLSCLCLQTDTQLRKQYPVLGDSSHIDSSTTDGCGG